MIRMKHETWALLTNHYATRRDKDMRRNKQACEQAADKINQSWTNYDIFRKTNLEISSTWINLPHVVEHLHHATDGSFTSVVIALRVFVRFALLVERVVGQVHEGLM